MKRLICIALVILFCLGVTACGSEKKGAPNYSASPEDNTPTSKRFFLKSKGVDAEIAVPQMKENDKVNEAIDTFIKDYFKDTYGVTGLSLKDTDDKSAKTLTIVSNYRLTRQDDEYFSAEFSGNASGNINGAPSHFSFGIVVDVKNKKLADMGEKYDITGTETQTMIVKNRTDYILRGYDPNMFTAEVLSRTLKKPVSYYLTNLKLGVILSDTYDYITLEIPLEDLDK